MIEVDPLEARSRRSYAFLAAILAVAALVRFVGLDWISVWGDELTWMNLARTDGPATSIHELPRQDLGGSPLHLLLLQVWLKCVGDSLLSARIASALCGWSAVVLVFAIGRRFYDTPTGLGAAWLAALNPLDVYQSREVRAYPWLVLLTCAGWYLLASFRRSAPLWKRVLYTLLLIFMLYTHPLGSLMVAALAVGYLLTLKDTSLDWKSWLAMNLIAAASFAPWMGRHLDHEPQIMINHWTASLLLGWPEGFTGGNYGALVLCGALIAFGLAWHWRHRSTPGLELGARLSLVWFLVPTILLLAYSFVSYPIFGPRRYLLFVGPAYLLLISRGISLLPRVTLRFAALTTLTTMAGTTMISRSFALERADWHGAASLIRSEKPTVPVVCMDLENRSARRACLGFYLDPVQQPVSAAQELRTLTTTVPESLWYVVETAPWNTAVPIPEDLTRRYVAQRVWKLRGVTLIHARIRGTEVLSHRDAKKSPL